MAKFKTKKPSRIKRDDESKETEIEEVTVSVRESEWPKSFEVLVPEHFHRRVKYTKGDTIKLDGQHTVDKLKAKGVI